MSGRRSTRPWLDWLAAEPIAHRGLHDAASGRMENSLSAFAAAVARGFAVEMDLRLSADEQAMVFHDDSLARLTGAAGRIGAMPVASLFALRLGKSTDHIPSLNEVLDLIGGRVPVYLELKSEDRSGDAALAEAVTVALKHYGGPAAVMSFSPDILRQLQKGIESRPIGLISYRYNDEWARDHLSHRQRFARRHLLTAASVGVDFIAYDVRALPAVAPLAARWALGLPLLAWTVRTPEQRAAAKRWADQMIFEGFDPRIVSGTDNVHQLRLEQPRSFR